MQLFVLIGFGAVPGQGFLDRIEVQVFEFSQAQLPVEGAPLRIEFDEQGVKSGIDRLAKPRDIQSLESVLLLVQGNQLISKAAVLHAVVNVNVADLDAFA